jgi:hypothetical protein
MLGARNLSVLAVAAVVLGAAAAPAHAVTYCVPATGPTCSGTSQATFQGALDAAAAAASNDTIEFTNSATYTGPFTYVPSASAGTLSIRGEQASGNVPTLRSLTNNSTTLDIQHDSPDTLSTVSHVKIEAPHLGIGLQTFGNVDHVEISASPAAQGAIGLYAAGSTVLTNLTIDMDDNGSPEQRGLLTSTPGGASAGETQLTDSSVTAYDAVSLGNPAFVHRNHIRSHGWAIQASCAGGVDLDSLVIVYSGDRNAIDAHSTNQCGASRASDVEARHVTLIGRNNPPRAALFAEGDVGGDGLIDLRSSIVRGFDIVIDRDHHNSPGSVAQIEVGHSNIDLTRIDTLSDGGAVDLGGNVVEDPLFVDDAADDFRLRWNSPGLETGEPGALGAGDSAFDIVSNPRVEDGNGDGTARRDKGAYEYRGPFPVVSIDPPTAQTGSPVQFGATTTFIHGSSKTYSWSFDDGFTSTQGAFAHAFATPGTHTGTVTVTDQTLRSATKSFSVVITAPPGSNPDPPAATPQEQASPSSGAAAVTPALPGPAQVLADTKAPALTARVKRGRRTRRVPHPGHTLTVEVDERSTITALVERCTRGGKKCTRRRRVKSFTRTGGPGSLSIGLPRTLASGRYRVTVNAVDAAGNHAQQRTVSFSVG